MNDPRAKLEKARQQFRERRLTFEHISSLPGRENITQEEYEEIIHFIEEMTLILLEQCMRKKSAEL